MSKPTLRQQAYETIHGWIIDGRLPKGAVTSETQLSQSLDMSRTPVRAALQQLELEGYIRIVSKHGILVLDSSAERVSELLDVIAALVLFAVDNLRLSHRREALIAYARHKEDELSSLMQSDGLDEHLLVQFEYELLQGILFLNQNKEIAALFRNMTARLYWRHNVKRWRTPHELDTKRTVRRLIQSLAADGEPFQDALLAYMFVLKQTWT